jgi:phosphoenolpyruvate phosphomutase
MTTHQEPNSGAVSSSNSVPTGRGSYGTGNVSPGRRLRDLLTADEPCQIMGAHDGLSAQIATAEGFRALWASGLCMSTALGVRDSDEASWTQLLAVTATMVDATSLPVLVDGDTGYGNFNTARRFSRKAERIGAAGICLEDKTFPKMNSFFSDGHHLAPVGEFCGKIMACKDNQQDPEFVVVARTEALIAGKPLEEALTRAHAYADAGADAIFIHSRQSSVAEIEAFCREWAGRLPIVVAPTTYHRTSLETFRELGVGGVIWANQSMRAAFTAMRQACREVMTAGGVFGIEDRIAPLTEVFSLLRYPELAKEEEHYGNVVTPTLLPTSTGTE